MVFLRYFVVTFVFLACTERASSVVTRSIQYQLLSIHSGRFIGVTTCGELHAMGDIRDPTTYFLPRLTSDGKWGFESLCNRGKYIVFQRVAVSANKTEVQMRLDVPTNDSELFEQISPFPQSFAYKSTAIAPEMCFMAFNSFGNSYNGRLCELDASHTSTHIMYFEPLITPQCDHSQLKTSRIEL